MPASEFKAKCFDVFKRLRDGRISSVTVTHRGVAVAIVSPSRVEVPDTWLDDLQCEMKGRTHLAEGVDLTEPIFEGETNAELGILYHGE